METIQTGLCQCGCGGKTSPARHNDPARGMKKGEFSRFVHGHYHIWKRKANPSWGSQCAAQRKREDTREKLVSMACENPKMTLEELRIAVAPSFQLEGVSLMLDTARQFMRIWGKEVPELQVRKKKKSVEPYERREIEYERETELPLLVRRWGVESLDKDEEEFHSPHERLPGGHETPLEALMRKEEDEETNRNAKISRYAARIGRGRL